MYWLAATAAGGFLGWWGAATNRVRTWDERLAWTIAGLAGAVPATFLYSLAAGPSGGLTIYLLTGVVGVFACPWLDWKSGRAPWTASFAIKWLRSPLTTTFGLAVAAGVRMTGRHIPRCAGMLFLPAGKGSGALTLGALAWTQNRRFVEGRVPEALAQHEAVHSRTVAAVGEIGFYATYLLIAAPWSRAQGSAWNTLNSEGLGNPFEKTAHTFTGDPAVAVTPRRIGRR